MVLGSQAKINTLIMVLCSQAKNNTLIMVLGSQAKKQHTYNGARFSG